MKLDKVYVLINPQQWMERYEQMVITLTKDNIVDFNYDSEQIVDFYSNIHSAQCDAMDIWDELQTEMNRIFGE